MRTLDNHTKNIHALLFTISIYIHVHTSIHLYPSNLTKLNRSSPNFANLPPTTTSRNMRLQTTDQFGDDEPRSISRQISSRRRHVYRRNWHCNFTQRCVATNEELDVEREENLNEALEIYIPGCAI